MIDFAKTFRDTAASLGLGQMVANSALAREDRVLKAKVRDEAERKKQGKRRKGQPHGSIIAYERKGPFYRQDGYTRVTLPSGKILLQPKIIQYFQHRFLHATKGWRVHYHIPLSMRRG